jgi:hypothetical protein
LRSDPNRAEVPSACVWVKTAGCRPSNSPAQELVCWQLGALLFETLRERISFAMGIDLWVGVCFLGTVLKRGQESLIGNPYPIGVASVSIETHAEVPST